MSSASIPVQRTPVPGSSQRRTLFWPMLVLIFGLGWQAFYQTMALEQQLDEVTRAVDKAEPNVKAAQRSTELYYALSRDVLALAPGNANAEQIVIDFKIREQKALKPTLFEAPATAAAPDTETNVMTSPATNAPSAESGLSPTTAPVK